MEGKRKLEIIKQAGGMSRSLKDYVGNTLMLISVMQLVHWNNKVN